MSDAWNDIQALKHRRAKMMERRKQREGLAAELTSSGAAPSIVPTTTATLTASDPGIAKTVAKPAAVTSVPDKQQMKETVPLNIDPEVEKKMLMVLCDISLDIPSDSKVIAEHTSRLMEREVDLMLVEELLRRFAAQKLISIKFSEGVLGLTVDSLDLTKLSAIAKGQGQTKKRRRDSDEEEEEEQTSKQTRPGSGPESGDIESLLSMQSTKEREEKKVNEEIQALLVTQTAKEQYLVEKFKSRGGPQLQEFCQYGTREECQRTGPEGANCKRLHFKKIIHKHTDESLGDCSFLNTCFHMDTCKKTREMKEDLCSLSLYHVVVMWILRAWPQMPAVINSRFMQYVHYEIDYPSQKLPSTDLMKKEFSLGKLSSEDDGSVQMFPPQWIQCDLRYFDMSTLGKCAVVMADPPWDIHMELPYGTMGDNEMRRLDIPGLQDEGFIFLWVTGRAMELGRECLELWGYKRCDEIIWVKTNQLQRIIRTGRTGHWINHGKEHCLVGVKGNPKGVNKGMDCDVIVAEVRATSHKPDEIYGIIERLSPGTRKVELFGRPHNVQPNWITLGNQVEGVKLKDPVIVKLFREKYPDGNCMGPPQNR